MADEREHLRRAWVDPQAPPPQDRPSLAPAGVAEWQQAGVKVGVAAPKPTAGLCSAWCTSADVLALGTADPDANYTQPAITASEILYELSGRRFRGVCTAVDRPGAPFPGPWPWDGYGWRWSVEYAGYGWWPADEGGVHDVRDWWPFLCGGSGVVALHNRPVRSITKVIIGGDEVPKTAFQIEDGYLLRRVDGGAWPAYQDLSRTSGPGTFSVEYAHGQEPPQAGRDAAAALAVEVQRARAGLEVTLPIGVTQIVRAGVTITRAAIAEVRKGGFGIPLVDLFLNAWPAGTGSVWSPDLAEPGPRIGGYP